MSKPIREIAFVDGGRRPRLLEFVAAEYTF